MKLPLWLRRLRAKKTRLSLAAATLAATLAFGYVFWPSSTSVPLPDSSGALAPETADPIITAEAPTEGPVEASPSPQTATPREGRPASVDQSLATLEIDSAKEALVFLDGNAVGSAPGTFGDLAPGEHVVLLDAGDGEREERTLVVTAGSTHRIRFDFEDTAPMPTRSSRTAGVLPSRSGERTHDIEPPELRRWSGFLTDQDCGATGGEQGALHLRCAEKCIREGQKPMFYTRGKLYRLEGFERIEIFRDQPLRFRGWVEGDTLHVVAPAEALQSELRE